MSLLVQQSLNPLLPATNPMPILAAFAQTQPTSCVIDLDSDDEQGTFDTAYQLASTKSQVNALERRLDSLVGFFADNPSYSNATTQDNAMSVDATSSHPVAMCFDGEVIVSERDENNVEARISTAKLLAKYKMTMHELELEMRKEAMPSDGVEPLPADANALAVTVENFPDTITREQLINTFSRSCGPVKRVTLPKIRGRSTRAHIQFVSEKSIPAALALNGQTTFGSQISVHMKAPRPQQTQSPSAFQFSFTSTL